MKITKEILDQELIDDGTKSGGVAYNGETVDDFMYTININPEEITIRELNEALKECGIKEI